MGEVSINFNLSFLNGICLQIVIDDNLRISHKNKQVIYRETNLGIDWNYRGYRQYNYFILLRRKRVAFCKSKVTLTLGHANIELTDVICCIWISSAVSSKCMCLKVFKGPEALTLFAVELYNFSQQEHHQLVGCFHFILFETDCTFVVALIFWLFGELFETTFAVSVETDRALKDFSACGYTHASTAFVVVRLEAQS